MASVQGLSRAARSQGYELHLVARNVTGAWESLKPRLETQRQFRRYAEAGPVGNGLPPRGAGRHRHRQGRPGDIQRRRVDPLSGAKFSTPMASSG